MSPVTDSLSKEVSRPTAGSSARSALISILGEFVNPYRRPVRTSALLYALARLGYGEPASRQAIARAGASGLITAEKDGRETKWSLTELGHRLFVEGTNRVFPDASRSGRWDGRWLVVIAPVPESHRAVRKKLYAAFRWAGFGNPSPGVWVTPHVDRLPEATDVIDSLGLSPNTVSFVGSPAAAGISENELVQRSWDLEKIADTYDELLNRFEDKRGLSGEAALVAHLELVDALRQTPYMDPHLPDALLPEWSGLGAVKRLQDLRTEWAPAAHAHWLSVARLD
ncbi:PaaX family transcriptional regulator [Rhodococcoides kyotonense]|uniref:Phenylacetic acid degradation operon negative regulatory protein n=1 Tax=Rhodococcoides kyotonense TaxID=398843 RepID=A0A239JZS3_9NOCA|nr:PaaX family transcriptional regulator C-terminal domain-containing protein [Rhodococcus kyotonensis]SNT11587.1 phenylacetic acid degradation operon negative regulatory protein [Rhodococcus kyotonensis]